MSDDRLARREWLGGAVGVLGGLVLGGCAGAAPRRPVAAAPQVRTTAGIEAGRTLSTPDVFFTKDISPRALIGIYSRISATIAGKVAIKLHTGEPDGPYILPREMVRALQQSIPDSKLVETNTLYKGKRETTADHRATIEHNGWDFCPVDIMDEDGAIMLPIAGGRRFREMSVGKHMLGYDALVVLTHFKGHTMGGYGGSMKNIGIGCADGPIGKKLIHGAPDADEYSDKAGPETWLKGKPFQENMVESAKATVDFFRTRIVYINVLRKMSVDCDCAGVTAALPKAHDLGILASTDLLAVEQASIDMVYALPEAELHDLAERIESRDGLHQLEHMSALRMGSRRYRMVVN
jgi:uncharacterized Fe-S center protein